MHVLSPGQNLNPNGHDSIGQFLSELLQDPSLHFTGLSIGQYVWVGQSCKEALHDPSLKQWKGKAFS